MARRQRRELVASNEEECTSKPITLAWGASSDSNSNRLGISSRYMLLKPVRLPPGRARLVKAVFDNFATFRQLHPALSTLKIKDMVPSASVIPIHPGALNYYREAGCR